MATVAPITRLTKRCTSLASIPPLENRRLLRGLPPAREASSARCSSARAMGRAYGRWPRCSSMRSAGAFPELSMGRGRSTRWTNVVERVLPRRQAPCGRLGR